MTRTLGQGAVVAGAYRLDGILLRCAHHMIVAATHAQLGARVVLELAWPTRIDSATVQRFLRDARAASQLRSEHVARVIDAGALDDGGFYVANDYVSGEELRRVLAQRGSVPAHEAAGLVIPVCEAIAEAHANDIVHRDLDLANLVVTRAGVKLLGIGRLTPLLRASHADVGTDIFALGRIVFELVTGRSPLVAGVALLRQRDLPPGFVAIVERCLDPDAKRRYVRAWDLAAALAVFAKAPQTLREAPPFTAASLVAVEADRLR